MRLISSESEVLAMVKSGQIELTASIQTDGFRSRPASQIPAVAEWIELEIRGCEPIAREDFLSYAPAPWYVRRKGEIYGPFSQQAILRLGRIRIAGDEAFSLELHARFALENLFALKSIRAASEKAAA